MSGFKRATVTISEEEYRRLHQADMKQRFQERKKAKTKQPRQSDLTSALREIENRQQQLEQAFQHLGQDLDWMGAETVQDILTQNAGYYESLEAMIGEVSSQANASFALLSEEFEAAMQQEREQHQQNIQLLIGRLDIYEHREQVKEEAARHWLQQCVVFADFIQEQLDHERFALGRLSQILGTLDFAQSNLTHGFFEASLQTSQQVFLQLSTLHLELEQRTLEWKAEYEKACHGLDQFLAELELNANIHALGLEGEELPEIIDVTAWSEGKYRQLLEECRKIRTSLLREQQDWSLEELKQINAQTLPFVTELFDSIIYKARLNALNSQLRMNIAETALQALETQGFRMNEAGYVDGKMHDAFVVRLENADGSRVVIEVKPTNQSNPELSNELVVITDHPDLKTEHEVRQQWQELCQSLNQYNLRVSRPEIHATPPVAQEADTPSPFVVQQPRNAEKHHNV